MMVVAVLLIALFSRCSAGDGEYVSPFSSTNTLYKDFKTRLLILETRYCGNLCEFRLVRGRRYGNINCDKCTCDDACHVYGDCCPDVDMYKNIAVENMCISASVKADDSADDSYRMVSSCPALWSDDDVRRSCVRYSGGDDIKLYVPVTDLTSKLTYKNRYCAGCHETNATVDWQITATCKHSSAIFTQARSSQELFALAIDTDGCNVVANPVDVPRLAARTCTPSHAILVSTCNVTGQWTHYDADIDRACALYTRVVLGKYKNMFCRLCNGDSWSDIKGEHMNPPVVNFAKMPLTALLQFGNNQDTNPQPRLTAVKKASPETICNNSQVYDSLMCVCRDILCADGKHLINSECRSYVQQSNAIGYRLCFNISATLASREGEDKHGVLGAFLDNITSTALPRISHGVFLTESSSRYVGVSDCGDVVHVEVQTQLSGICPRVQNQDALQMSLFELVSQISRRFEIATGANVQFSGNCRMHDESAENPGQINNETLRSRVQFPQAIAYVSLVDFVKYVDFNRFLFCPHITVKKHYFRKSQFPNCETVFRSVQFDVNSIGHEDVINVCMKNLSKSNEAEDHTLCVNRDAGIDWGGNGTILHTPLSATPLGVLSVVCTGVSLASLLVTLILYSWLRDLRTTGGVCNMGLVANMFTAQVVYEFGMEQNEDRLLCSVLGVLIHFFWLAVVLWMNACVVQFFFKLCFPLKAHIAGVSTRATFVIATVYSYGVSAVAVGANILAHELTHGDVGYGGNVCYFNTVNGQIFAFVLPVGLVTVSNIVLLVVTVVTLRRSKGPSGTGDHRVSLVACVKLSTLTGLTWIFGFLYQATSVLGLAYVFTVLVGGQGFLLFLALMVNKRVFKLLRDKVGSSQHDKYNTSHSVARTSSTDTRL